MAVPISAAMPPDLDFGINYTIRIAALDPVTGDPVSGVVVSDTSIFAQTPTGSVQITPESLPPILEYQPLPDEPS